MLAKLLTATVAALAFAGCAGFEEAASAAIDAAGCADFSAAQATTDVFQYSGAAACKSGTESYEWPNPSPVANLQWGGAAATGSIEVRILDAAGREVGHFGIDGTTAESWEGRTDFGMPAPVSPPMTWTIEITFDEFTGTMGLQVFPGP